MEIQQICSLLEIDWQACVSRFSGNEGLYRRFLFRFPQDETWEQLVRAWEQQDIPGVERGAHHRPPFPAKPPKAQPPSLFSPSCLHLSL